MGVRVVLVPRLKERVLRPGWEIIQGDLRFLHVQVAKGMWRGAVVRKRKIKYKYDIHERIWKRHKRVFKE